MIFYNTNESIEGKIISCSFRRGFKPFRPEQNDMLNCKVYPFEVGNDGRAEIIAGLEPKEFKIDTESHLDKGDQLRGDILSGFAVKPVKNISIDHRTHSHKAKFIKTKKYAYIRIDRPYNTLKTLLNEN